MAGIVGGGRRVLAFGAHVIALVEDALSDALGYHAALDNFVLRAGVRPGQLTAARDRALARAKDSGRFSKAPKRFVAQELLKDLTGAGAEGDRVLASIITALCKGNYPNASENGKKAIEALIALHLADRQERQEEAEARRQEALQREREEEKLREKAGSEKRAARERLRTDFLNLCQTTDAQARGYMLEGLITSLFALEGLDPRASFKLVGEQIDGSFAWEGRTHLVEAKWVAKPVDGSGFGGFMFKIEGKSADTRGLFVSINGYSREALTALKQKGEARFVCLDGAHLMRCLEPGGNLAALLRSVWRYAGETGEAYCPVSALSK